MDHRWRAGFPWNYDRDEIIADGVIVSFLSLRSGPRIRGPRTGMR
jgi:hypothetical protein